MNSICVVSTPMQLINSIELVKFLNISNNDLLILASTVKRGNQIISIVEKLLLKSFFSSISIIAPSSNIAVVNSFLMKRSIKKHFLTSKYDNLIISNYKEVFVRYAYYCSHKRNQNVNVYVVDDGLSLLDIVSRRNSELQTRRASLSITSRHLYAFFSKTIIKDSIANKLIFFTNQDDLKIETPDERLINEYVFLKQYLVSRLHFDYNFEICIIGQPLPQFGLLDKQKYNDCLLSFIIENKRQNSVIKYIPHPAERVGDSINERLRKLIDIADFELPLEIYALGFKPSIIVLGFFSAALYNIHKLRPELRVVGLYPNSDGFGSLDNSRDIDQAYSTLYSSGVERYDIAEY